jgi:cell division protein ZapA (FtsZ GTPase activity inhibitor)
VFERPVSAESVSAEPVSAEPNWYDITIAGKKFTIASRHGETHIRAVEKLIADTYGEVASRMQGQTAAHVALLTALNLADELINAQHALRAQYGDRIEDMLARLGSALDSPAAPLH